MPHSLVLGLLIALPTFPCLFGFPAPPRPPTVDSLISTIAEAVLWGRLREAQRVEVTVDTGSPLALLGGAVQGVRIRGAGWCTPLQLSCRSLDVSVGRTAVDVGALVTKRAILLQWPATGDATICFSAKDWSSFLAHPLCIEAISARLREDRPIGTSAAPSFGSKVSFADGAICFPVKWGSTELCAVLSQPPGSSTAVVTATPVEPTQEREAGLGAAREAAAWLADFFNELELNLDGVRFSFVRLQVGRDETLKLGLRVVVERFPSPMVNF